jgi:hypothetical protein
MVAYRRTPHGKATRGCRSGAPSTPLHEFGGTVASNTASRCQRLLSQNLARCTEIHGGAASGQPRCPHARAGPVLPRPWGVCPWEWVRCNWVRGAIGLGRRAARNPGSGTVQPLRRKRACAVAATVRLPRIRSRPRAHRLGQEPLCAPHSTAQACSLRGAREGGATGAGCEGTVNRTRCGARSPLLRIAACDRRPGCGRCAHLRLVLSHLR